MTLSQWRSRRRVATFADAARGTLQVIAATMPPNPGGSVTFSNYRLTGVVSAPGLPPTAVTNKGICRVSTWPSVGQQLPVTVDRQNPDRLVIAWDELPDAETVALAQARNLALHEQTNLDFTVLDQAITPGTAPTAAGDAAGHVLAAFPNPVQDAPGGVWDLTVAAAGRVVTVPLTCATTDERDAWAHPGAAVTVRFDASVPEVASFVRPTEDVPPARTDP
jgi:hypothetical protein